MAEGYPEHLGIPRALKSRRERGIWVHVEGALKRVHGL